MHANTEDDREGRDPPSKTIRLPAEPDADSGDGAHEKSWAARAAQRAAQRAARGERPPPYAAQRRERDAARCLEPRGARGDGSHHRRPESKPEGAEQQLCKDAEPRNGAKENDEEEDQNAVDQGRRNDLEH